MSSWAALSGQVFLYQRGRVAALLFLLLYLALGLHAERLLEAAVARPEHNPLLRAIGAPVVALRQFVFDSYQRIAPRTRVAQTVAIVGIDEDSLKTVGQWPWPRDRLAALIDAIARHRPLAIGLDIYMPEADQTSPEQVAARLADGPPEMLAALRALAPHDRRLAQSLQAAPTVLGAAGFPFATLATSSGMRSHPIQVRGADPAPHLRHFPYVLASLPQLQAAASGQALVSVDEVAVVRRYPLAATIGPELAPSLAMEMLRVASQSEAVRLDVAADGVRAVEVADLRVPTQRRGDIWLHFAPESQGAQSRNIPAVRLFEQRVAADAITDKLVLIGLTGSGLNDRRMTPLGENVPGIEIQAQVLESMLDGRLLLRPWWMGWAEAGVLLAAGLLLVRHGPDGLQRASGARGLRRLRVGAWVALACVLALAGGLWLFVRWGLLFDGASFSIGLAALLASLVSSSTLEVERANRRLALEQQQLREQAARLAGEMEAARRIQLGSLPDAARAFPGETRFALDALIEPAREVGGDLYDFFMVDARHLCFLIGDVSGKGVPASLFMAVTKALTRSFALRLAGGPAEIVSAANRDLSRENVETLFVTLLLGVLDVDSGRLLLVNAGHDGPWCLGADGALRQLSSAGGSGGPPLCVIDDFAYPVQEVQLLPGDRLLMVTDGITEASDADGQLYGSARLRAALAALPREPTAAAMAHALRADVGAFVGAAEPSDDLAILVLHWRGAAAPGTPAAAGA